MIKSENSRPAAWLFVDIRDIDVGTYIKKAQAAIKANLKLPEGYSYIWSGEFEYMEQARKRFELILPITLAIIFFILYINTASVTKVMIILLAVPFSLVGAVWLLYLLGYHISVAVVVGLIALAGLDAETGVVMLLYLDIAYHRHQEAGQLNTYRDTENAVIEGAVQRLRAQAHDGAGHPHGAGGGHAHSLRRQRQARQCDRAAGPGGDRRRAGGRRQPQARLVHRDRQVLTGTSCWACAAKAAGPPEPAAFDSMK